MTADLEPSGGTASESSAPDGEDRSKRLVRRIAAVALGIGFSALCFAYLGQKVDLAELKTEVQGLRVGFIIPAALCVAFNIAIRGYRWGLMLPRAYVPRPAAAVFPASIGLAINGLLPGKAGELSRIVYCRFVFGLSLVTATASVLAERLVDMAVLCVILAAAIVLKGPEDVAPAVFHGAQGFLILAALTSAGMAAVFTRRGPGESATAPETEVEAAARSGAEGFLQKLKLAVHSMRSGRAVVGVWGATFLGWGALILTNWLVAEGFESMPLSFAEIMALTSISIIATGLPSLPGAWGVFEGSIVALAPVVGIAANDAELLTYGLVIHLVQYSTVLAMGGTCGMADGARRG